MKVWQLLDRPAIFHAARFALVGRQGLTKRFLREHLAAGPDETVLDVCCGIGEFAEAATSRYVGVDANERFHPGARRRYAGDERKSFEVGDVLRLSYPARHFDKAIVVNSLHHFSDAEATGLLCCPLTESPARTRRRSNGRRRIRRRRSFPPLELQVDLLEALDVRSKALGLGLARGQLLTRAGQVTLPEGQLLAQLRPLGAQVHALIAQPDDLVAQHRRLGPQAGSVFAQAGSLGLQPGQLVA